MHKLWRTIAPPDTFDEIGALFSWASKVIRNFICFASLCSVIGRPNSRHLLNQSQLKMKQITTWSPAFSRSSERFTWSCYWLPGYFPLSWLAGVTSKLTLFLLSLQRGEKANVPVPGSTAGRRINGIEEHWRIPNTVPGVMNLAAFEFHVFY